MELQDEELAGKDHELTVDLSKQTLKRIERANNKQKSAVTLILDHNEIQRLDNLETYPNLTKLSLVNNQLVRMYGVSPLMNLVTLDISHNSLVTIEGLKDLKELKYLNLAKNRIKSIEHLNCNLKLEKIDLSENNIMRISDISFLENLKELNLHGNRINHLSQCEKKLPNHLEVLTLNNNSLSDLNEVSHLVHLTSLKELSIANNPCLDFSEDQKFNYRPFVKNWCSSVIILDNRPLDDIECLKAEWLYSQGRGRSFKPGEHGALTEYLISVCPREAEENAETEDVKKLKLILSKAQLHQQQLREQLLTGKFTVEGFKPPLFKKKTNTLPERMVTSFQDSPAKELRQSPDHMARSLDSGMMRRSLSKVSKRELNQTALQASTTFIPIPDSLISPDVSQPVCGSYPKPSSISSQTSRSSSITSSHFTHEKRKSGVRRQSESSSPVTLKKQDKQNFSRTSTPFDVSTSTGKISINNVSPIRKGTKSKGIERNCRETSEEEDSEVLAFKIKAIQQRVNQRKQNKSKLTDKGGGNVAKKEKPPANFEKDLMNSEAWKAAICIQKWWRGYRTRNLNGEVLSGCKSIQMNRMQDYIIKVVNDMEATRVALEGNRKLVILQMQAINALWKKMMALQPAVGSQADDKISLHNLMETCSVLNKQVEGLQTMMKTMQASSSSIAATPIATQTDIVAVHTPQGKGKEIFPYAPKLKPQHSDGRQYLFDSFEAEGQSLREIDSDNSTTGTIKAVTELYSNFNINDASEASSLSVSLNEKDVHFLSESLTKPSVKLSENNYEVPSGLQNESEKSEDLKVENCES